ncbi:hypothetical protein Q9L58_007403 [Maublancomyces gigas]|uniref:BTB domain-containing protein n=1 Tax=Discina gigas TaxID=1032678 RepID=A0ABR3GCP6_9PEZI
MTTQLSDRLGSVILELTAGDGRKSFFVHKNLIVEQSAFLRSSIDATAVDRRYDLKSWDSDTVGYFVNFLYLHTYTTGGPEPLNPAAESTASDTTGAHSRVHTPDTVFSGRTIQPGYSFGETGPRPLTPLENLDQDDGSGACQDIAEDSYYTSYPQETHDYHDVLFAHAKVYALAQYLHVDSLVSMAYQRLSIILAGLQPITPFPHTTRSVVELLRYVYTHTEETGDWMRKLVSQFTALNYPAVQGTAEMEENGGSEEELNKSQEIAAGNAPAGEELRAERAKVALLEDRNDTLLKSRQGVRVVSVRVAILATEMFDSKLAGVSTFGDRLDLLLDELQKLL